MTNVTDNIENCDIMNDNSFCDISEFAQHIDLCSGNSSCDSDDDHFSKSESKSTIRPDIEKVEPLSVEEIRWFYCTKKSKFKPMLGYDSIRLETEWRLFHDEQYSSENIKRVSIRGGMYEADVLTKQCHPVYWSSCDVGESKDEGDSIIRGSWFFEMNGQPLDEVFSDRIEKEHLERWKGIDLREIKNTAHGGVMHSVQLDGCHVDWNSVNDVILYKDATTHRAFRNIVQKFGVSKATSGGYRLRRGYEGLAVIFDNHLPVSHLFFVVHGIGAKSDKRKVVRNTGDFRFACRRVKPKNFTERVEFVPVEWRSKVSLDGDMVDSITPKKSQTIRSFVNNTALDVLYYTSPLYRNDIVSGLRNELNRIYKRFMERNPSFDGKICVFAHSLGCVILHDILCNWNADGGRSESVEASECLNHLVFNVDHLFCVGSPLGLFLCLRGYQPSKNGVANQDNIIPTTACRRIFNVFHPADPVAYRLEPLLLPHYKDISPVQLMSYHSIVKSQASRTYSPGSSSPVQMVREESTQSFDDDTNDDLSSERTDNVDTDDPATHRKSYFKSVSMAVAGGAARLGRGLWHRARSSPTDLEDDATTPANSDHETEKERKESVEASLPELEDRIDYELPEGFTESKLGYASLTSHTSYWNNQDLAMFIMTQLLSGKSHGSS